MQNNFNKTKLKKKKKKRRSPRSLPPNVAACTGRSVKACAMSSTTEPAAPAIAHVKRRLVPDDLNSTTTFRWTPPEASSWGKAKLAAWDSLSTAVRGLPHPPPQCAAERARLPRTTDR
jgi:hypothetical protein